MTLRKVLDDQNDDQNSEVKEAENYKNSLWMYTHAEQPAYHLNYFLRNNLFLSRVFLQNAKRMHLLEQFTDKKTINILDVGCGLACSLMGVMTYFGEERIKYLGIDINEKSIKECEYSYQNFSRLNFLATDGLKFLSDPKYANQFDLVLIQHPNFVAPQCWVECFREIFTELFINSQNVLAEGGIIYSTIYEIDEKNYFKEHVLPQLKGFESCELIESDICPENNKPKESKSSPTPFMAENYVFKSSSFRPELLLSPSVASKDAETPRP